MANRQPVPPPPPRSVVRRRKLPPEKATVADRLERARSLSSNLRVATDNLNVALERAESALAGLNLGVTAKVELRALASDPEDPNRFRLLWFRKQGSSWKFIVEAWDARSDYPDSEAELLQASREIREMAADHIPRLLDALINVAEAKVASVNKAANKISNFVDELHGRSNGDKEAEGEE